MSRSLHRRLFGFPDFLEIRKLALELGQLFLEIPEPLFGRVVRFLVERFALDLELDDPALELVHRLGFGVDFDADPRRRLVDQVDRLVRQLSIRDVAMRQRGRRNDGRIGDLDPVVHFVSLFESAEDRNRILDRRFLDQHFLEASFEGSVLLQVLAILIERCRADAVQFTPGERRLQHVAGVHRAFRLASADHCVQLVDEQDNLSFLLGQVVQHGFQALFELTAELGAGDQRAHVERQDSFVPQTLGDFVVDDPLGEPLDDGGLADAGLADQDRVVLRTALQNLDRPPDLVVATDDRVELALFSSLGEVDGVFLQGLPRILGIRIVDLLAATDLVDRLLDGAVDRACLLQHGLQGRRVIQRSQHEQFARNVLVIAFLRQLVREIQQLREAVGDVDFAPGPLDFRQAVERLTEL